MYNRCCEEVNDNKDCELKGIECAPVMECPEERCCHREIIHDVTHIVPINTRIINHHIYRHVFRPCYTCCEENEICNVYQNNKCNF